MHVFGGQCGELAHTAESHHLIFLLVASCFAIFPEKVFLFFKALENSNSMKESTFPYSIAKNLSGQRREIDSSTISH